MDSTSAFVMLDSPVASDIEGLPIEAFAQVHDIFNDLDWGETDLDNALTIIQQMTVSSILEEKLDFTGFPSNRKENWQNVPDAVQLEDDLAESLRGSTAVSEANSPPTGLTEMLTASLKSSLELASATKKVDPSGLHVSVQRPAQSKIISPRISQTSPSNQGSNASSSQVSPVTLSRYHSAPLSAVGITALLQDHAEFSGNEVSSLAPESSISAAATLTDSSESLKSGSKAAAAAPPPPPPPPQPPSQSSSDSVCPQPPPPPPQPPTIGTTKPPPPPPPPSSSNVQSSPKSIPPPPMPLQGATPPPPPPPQRAGTTKDAPAKGVPPPPAPLLNASSKPGGGSPSGSSLLGGKGKLQLRTSTKAQATKKSSLKPYHWLKLTRAMQGSLWADAQKPEEASKYVTIHCLHLYFPAALLSSYYESCIDIVFSYTILFRAPELDLSELESLFSATVSNPDGGPGRKTNMRGSTVKTEKVHLVK